MHTTVSRSFIHKPVYHSRLPLRKLAWFSEDTPNNSIINGMTKQWPLILDVESINRQLIKKKSNRPSHWPHFRVFRESYANKWPWQIARLHNGNYSLILIMCASVFSAKNIYTIWRNNLDDVVAVVVEESGVPNDDCGMLHVFNEMPTRFYWKAKRAWNNCRQYLTFCQSNAEKKPCCRQSWVALFCNLKKAHFWTCAYMLGCIWHRYVDLVWIWLMHVTWCDVAYK